MKLADSLPVLQMSDSSLLPHVTSLQIILKDLTNLVACGESDTTIQHQGPFIRLMPMKLTLGMLGCL